MRCRARPARLLKALPGREGLLRLHAIVLPQVSDRAGVSFVVSSTLFVLSSLPGRGIGHRRAVEAWLRLRKTYIMLN
jgi:hypothetical protein